MYSFESTSLNGHKKYSSLKVESSTINDDVEIETLNKLLLDCVAVTQRSNASAHIWFDPK